MAQPALSIEQNHEDLPLLWDKFGVFFILKYLRLQTENAVFLQPNQPAGGISSWETWSSNTRLRSRGNPQSYLGGTFNTVQVYGGGSQALYLGPGGYTGAMVQELVRNHSSSAIPVAGLECSLQEAGRGSPPFLVGI